MKTKKADGRAEPVQLDVKPIGPLIVTTVGAATAIDRSTSWLRQQRGIDAKRIAQGLAPIGPAWCTLGNTIVYRVADLETWLEKRIVQFGRVPFRGDMHGEER